MMDNQSKIAPIILIICLALMSGAMLMVIATLTENAWAYLFGGAAIGYAGGLLHALYLTDK